MRDLIAALAEVYPELALPEGGGYPGDRPFMVPPVAWFGDEDVVLMLMAGEGGLTLAEPELCWDHPNIPSWKAVPKFPIPQAWTQALTAKQRETLKSQAQEIGESRLGKYARCALCKELRMPEHLMDYRDDGRMICEGCANHHLGIVH